MSVQPDVAGFADAQVRLRTRLGVDAVFIIPESQTWGPDVPIDPETGEPYDPFTTPETTVAAQEITVRCSFVHRPLSTSSDTRLGWTATPIGAIDRGIAALIIPVEQIDPVRSATRVRVGEEVWDIDLFRYDVALTVPRWIAYLSHA